MRRDKNETRTKLGVDAAPVLDNGRMTTAARGGGCNTLPEVDACAKLAAAFLDLCASAGSWEPSGRRRAGAGSSVRGALGGGARTFSPPNASGEGCRCRGRGKERRASLLLFLKRSGRCFNAGFFLEPPTRDSVVGDSLLKS
ncbi:hypothetical protein MRX96_027021 [Rhipicephalus microplus]